MKRLLTLFFACFVSMTLIGKFLLPASKSSDKDLVASEEVKKKESSSFSFMAVGDNLIHDPIYYDQMMAGQGYNFDSLYSLTKKYSEQADLAYINLETLCAGEEFELSGYPTFNAPTEILDAALASGFNWVAASSNHSLDRGKEGLLHEVEYLHSNYPDVALTGAHSSKEDAKKYTVKEINGIRVGLLGYTYGTNGIPIPEDAPWIVDLISEEKIREDMEALNKISDVQIVSMHWGQEYQTSPNQEQIDYANLLNELGVEVIIGSHPHVIQPVEWIRNDKQETLVYYSLGNFISSQDTNDRMVGGMANFTLQYDFEDKTTTFKDVKFIPTVTMITPDLSFYQTTTIHEFTDDMAANHQMTSLGYDMSKEWINQYVQEVLKNPEGIEVITG